MKNIALIVAVGLILAFATEFTVISEADASHREIVKQDYFESMQERMERLIGNDGSCGDSCGE